MPHCQKEFAKPPVSSRQKKAQQQEKKAAAKAKAAKRAKEEDEEEEARAGEQQERDPAEVAAELARAREAEEKEAAARKLRDAKMKGGEAFKAGKWAKALEHYCECIELDPEDYINWSNRAAVHRHQANFEEALADATKCTELNPEFVKGWARIGGANLALRRFDAAEEAFQHGLTLEPDNAACMDGIEDIAKAREEPADEDESDALATELKGLDLTQLQARAREEGLDEVKIEEAGGGEDPKGALVNLITAHKYLVNLVTEELQGLELEQLQARALEEGLAEEAVTEAASLDDAIGALTALIVKHLSNDLVDAAIEMQAEMAEEYDEESDYSDDDGDIDFEVVTVDETDLQPAVGEVFLAGAYIDETYGELVLPNGARLGNRSLKMFYKQRVRPTNNLQLASAAMDRLNAKIKNREDRKMMVKNAQIGLKGALATQPGFKSHHLSQPNNKAMRAIVHHWGGGGGGAHYNMAGSKQYNKGNKVKGVVLRHSVQGAKLQAARNKTNRGNKSVACLQ
mmetsp:Transcript_11624/g.32766  ORF Transcript_11624/g.32766 Transcript_11624/m.32766 type:complete len:515 (-) Transcript_11624:435-1979(-)